MPHFFISYAKKDTRELAIQIEAALNALPNVTAWVDKSLRAGRSWEIQIETEIRRCDYMIVLYSPDVNRHQHGEEESYVLTEINYAKFTAHKTIIPVMAQKTDAPISLTTAHYIDFTLPNFHIDDLILAICDEAGVRMVSLPSAPPPPRIEKSSKTPIAPARPTSTSILPAPFAWIDIPGKGYSIAKYPITNAQFAKFIEADGYNQKKWWTDEGWGAKLKGWGDGTTSRWWYTPKVWTQPRYWTDANRNDIQQPVVGVSWYEAVAFCLWLSDVTDEIIMLPTDDQWKYAAQGDDGRSYPWGSDWDCEKCNNSVEPCNSNGTTPVRQYEGKGDSPFGVTDMVGNVWEFCLTDDDNKTNDYKSVARFRVLHGGCWDLKTGSVYFRSDYRSTYYPYVGDNNVGFRISRS